MSDEINIKSKIKKMKRLLILPAVVIVLVIIGLLWKVASKGVTSKKVERQLSIGENYLSELDYEQAIAAYELAIEIDPKCAEAYLGLAEVYEELGEFQKAEEILEEAEDVIEDEEELSRIKRKEKKVKKKQQNPENQEDSDSESLSTEEILSTMFPEFGGEFAEMEEIRNSFPGDYVTFGTYEQDNNPENGPEAIRWLVLDKKDGKALLLSEYALDAKAYHEEYEAVTWETCTLRKWLNEEFYFMAFAETEREAVGESLIVNRDNVGYGVDGGNDTVDKVFLLSLDEISTYFTAPYEMYDSSRFVKVTDYAKAQGALVYEEFEIEFYANGWWWLRSPGAVATQAARVLCSGYVADSGEPVTADYNVVRPALWITY